MKYRKRPVIIEAEQYLLNVPVTPFIRDATCIDDPAECRGLLGRHIHTLEGELSVSYQPRLATPCIAGRSRFRAKLNLRRQPPGLVSDGDWLIKGIKNEFYPCKPDIFDATYEVVPPPDPTPPPDAPRPERPERPDLKAAKRKAVNLIGWFVSWDDSLPLRRLFIWDDDTQHCTYWMWRQRFAGWFVCPRKGHEFYPDMCGRPEHDICERCETRRDEVEHV